MTQRRPRPLQNIHSPQVHEYPRNKTEFGGRRRMQFERLSWVPARCKFSYENLGENDVLQAAAL